LKKSILSSHYDGCRIFFLKVHSFQGILKILLMIFSGQ